MTAEIYGTTASILNLPNWPWLGVVAAAVAITIIIVGWRRLTTAYIKPESAENRKDAVLLLLQTLGGVAFIIGAWFTWQQLIISREELKNSRDVLITTQQAQITERFTRAIEQLGKSDDAVNAGSKGTQLGTSKNLAIRLGGIYALERISRDSETDYPAVIDVFTAFVRENAPLKGKETIGKVKPDIQAILSVLGRRMRSYGKGESQRIDLSATNLSGADLVEANLAGANLTSSQLQETHLNRANLNDTQMLNANLSGAFLERANLSMADLRGVNFKSAHVNEANFSGANLDGADLREAEGLTIDQIKSAKSKKGLLVDAALDKNP